MGAAKIHQTEKSALTAEDSQTECLTSHSVAIQQADERK